MDKIFQLLEWLDGQHLDPVWLLPIIGVVSFFLSFIGSAVGLILGHLRLPLLIAYLRSPAGGSATNLIISGCGALAGTVRHIREGRVSWVGLAVMGIPSAIGAIIAVHIFVRINPLWSFLVIGIMLIISGINLIRKKPTTPPPGEISMTRRIIIEVVIGLILGALAAITGLMLGSLRLPMMIKYLRMDSKQAIGTNMAVGCLTGLVGVLTAFLSGHIHLNLLVLAAVVPPTLLGGYLGGWLTGKLSKEGVQRLAGWIITFSGVILLGQAGTMAYRKTSVAVPPFIVSNQIDEDDEEISWDDDWANPDEDLLEEEL